MPPRADPVRRLRGDSLRSGALLAAWTRSPAWTRSAPPNEGALTEQSRPFKTHPHSAECVEGGFCEVVGFSLLLRVCGFFNYLQALDRLEGEAHHAALLAPVLDVDGLVVVVDEYLGEHPAVVVEALSPLWDGLVAYLARLLAHA